MPVSTTSPITILPATQSSGGSLKNSANSVRYTGGQRQDADLWASVAKALESGQNQIDLLMNTLRAPIPLPDPIQILNPDGSLVAQIGHILGADNRSYPGIWGSSVYIGGAGPDTANIVADETGIFMENVPITIDSGGYTITIASISGSLGFQLHKNDGTSNIRIIGSLFDIGSDTLPGRVAIQMIAGNGRIDLGSSIALGTVILQGNPGTIDTIGYINSQTGFQVGPFIGATGVVSAATNLNISYGTAITSVFGPGISGFTQSLFVTGVTMLFSSFNVHGGIITP